VRLCQFWCKSDFFIEYCTYCRCVVATQEAWWACSTYRTVIISTQPPCIKTITTQERQSDQTGLCVFINIVNEHSTLSKNTLYNIRFSGHGLSTTIKIWEQLCCLTGSNWRTVQTENSGFCVKNVIFYLWPHRLVYTCQDACLYQFLANRTYGDPLYGAISPKISDFVQNLTSPGKVNFAKFQKRRSRLVFSVKMCACTNFWHVRDPL